MALTLGDNFSYQGAKPLDGRLKYDTVAAMKAMADSTLYDGCLAYCVATDKTYQWKSTNTVDPDLGRWREFGDTVDSAISSTSENPVQNKAIHDALDGKADLVNGKVPAAQLPAYVDDVIEGYYKAADDRFYEEPAYETLIAPESGKSWVDISTNKSYRWTGDRYVRVDEGVQLGETADTAYRGDRGKVAYDISQTIGDVGDLNTTEKSSVIGAINEVQNFNNLVNRPVKEVTSIQDIITPLPVDNGSKWSEKNGVLFYDGKPYSDAKGNNINIYINSETGVDDFDSGYGFSAAKPFASIDYAVKYAPLTSSVNRMSTSGQMVGGIVQFFIQGVFTYNTWKAIEFNRVSLPIYINISGDTTLTNVRFLASDCLEFSIKLINNANLTMNKTIASTAATSFIISAAVSTIRIQREGSLSTFTFNNTSGDSYTRGIQVGTSRMCIYFPLVFNNCQRALSIHDASHVYLHSATGTASEFGIFANYGSIVGYGSFSVTAPTVTRADTGARIYTGSQS